MKKPNTLTQLLEELHGEAIVSAVDTAKESKVIVYINERAADEDDGIIINRSDSELVLANASIIERFYEALGSPSDASIVLVELIVPEPSLDALEKHFAAVDEG
jgi:hypothetical protein